MGPEEVFAADQEAAADEEDLEIDCRALPCQTNHVLVGCRRLGDTLLFKCAFDVEEPIAQARRLLEFLMLRRPLHLGAQVVQQFMVAPFEKLAHLFDDVAVVFFRLIAGAGRHAPFDLEFDTGSLRLAVDLDRAGCQGEGFLDDFQCLPQGACRRVGALVECAVLLHAADDGEAREVLFDRQAKVGVLLVVP